MPSPSGQLASVWDRKTQDRRSSAYLATHIYILLVIISFREETRTVVHKGTRSTTFESHHLPLRRSRSKRIIIHITITDDARIESLLVRPTYNSGQSLTYRSGLDRERKNSLRIFSRNLLLDERLPIDRVDKSFFRKVARGFHSALPCLTHLGPRDINGEQSYFGESARSS